MKLIVLPGGRSTRRRNGLFARIRAFWRVVVVRRLLLAVTGWALIEGGRTEGRPGRAA